jgi:dTMP kinase
MRRSLIVDTHASSCYFRTSVGGDGRKALVQITERCNLHCAHCFVSSGDYGDHMRFEDVVERVLPRLKRARVERLTLTGGEPFVHPAIIEICAAVADTGLPLGICTNATQTMDEQIARLKALGNVHINVSFDGFRPESHGKFRGSQASFATTVATTRKFAEAGLLQGLLSTPNALTEVGEFAALCEFAVEVGAEYVLMNPLSAFGRGVKSQDRLAADGAKMRAIQAVTGRFRERGIDLTHIRFPNDDKPLSGCDIGKLIYVFVDGQLAVCPYIVFAAPHAAVEAQRYRVPGRQHLRERGWPGAGRLRLPPAVSGWVEHQVRVVQHERGLRQGLSGSHHLARRVHRRGGQRTVPSAGRFAVAPDWPPGARMNGMFIAVEGPNGVGKTTVASLLVTRLRERQDVPVHLTSEPSNTPLGRLLRSSEAVLTGRALALAVAADRYAHLDAEVVPLLDAGTHVVSDRYVQSSLVLQRVDGLALTEIWRYNAYVLPPTVSFYLEDDPDVIRERLASRGQLSRLELTGSPIRELSLYGEARTYLRRHDWEQVTVDCRGQVPEQIVARILKDLDKYAE